ncbi:hypothetical protein ACIRU3_41885 [Streptomyces sp. NPDC101151]|uniref:hypothetical protein n=1 Tax=Streptomyces sp. NPDC101151 TaxID=3366115 RepID=UPI0037F660C5
MPHPENLLPDDAIGLKEIRAACPELDATVEHVRSFAGLMHEHRSEDLATWIEQVRQDDPPHLRQFADGRLHDLDAVIAGLSTSTSTPTNGSPTKARPRSPAAVRGL